MQFFVHSNATIKYAFIQLKNCYIIQTSMVVKYDNEIYLSTST